MPSHNSKNTKANRKLLEKHPELTHSENRKVCSHTQRNDEDWVINTIMLDDFTIPFRFKRKKLYQNLTGARVNLTYYPTTELVGGLPFEVMNVVRIKRS